MQGLVCIALLDMHALMISFNLFLDGDVILRIPRSMRIGWGIIGVQKIEDTGY